MPRPLVAGMWASRRTIRTASSSTGTIPARTRSPFSPDLAPDWHLPERRAQIQRREELRVPQLGKAIIDAGNRVCVLYRHCIQVTGVSTKPELPPFFLAMTTPQAHGDFDGSIMSYHINISISFLHASDLCGVSLLAPSL